MDRKVKGIVGPLLYADEEMESAEVRQWPPNMKVFDLPKKIRETSTDRAAAGAARAVAESDHRQGTTAGLLSQGCTEQDVQGGFLGEGAESLPPLLFSPESMANRALPFKQLTCP